MLRVDSTRHYTGLTRGKIAWFIFNPSLTGVRIVATMCIGPPPHTDLEYTQCVFGVF